MPHNPGFSLRLCCTRRKPLLVYSGGLVCMRVFDPMIHPVLLLEEPVYIALACKEIPNS